MANTPTYYALKTQVTGQTYKLSGTAGGSGSYTTSVSIPALSAVAVVRQFIPEVAGTSANATIPAATATFGSGAAGWASTSADPLIQYGDAGSFVGTESLIFNLQYSPNAAITAGQATFTVIIFLNGTEIGRGTLASAAVAANAAGTGFVSIGLANNLPIPANSVIACAVYVSSTNLSVTTALSIGIVTGAGPNYINALVARIIATRSTGDSTSQADTSSRALSLFKTAGESTGSTDAASRTQAVFRAGSESTSLTDVASRNILAPRTGSELTAQVDAASRVSTDFRRAVDVATNPVDGAARAITKSITISDSMTTIIDTAQKTITYGRGAREYFQPTDPPVTVPTKHIAGIVRDSAGLAWTTANGQTSGATVTLIRDSDGLVISSQISSLTDGSYSFVRDFYDTNTYTVKGFVSVAGTPEQDITRPGLVPV